MKKLNQVKAPHRIIFLLALSLFLVSCLSWILETPSFTLGAITEIKLYEAKGLKLVGPLPAEIQNYTSYEAALMTGASSADAARAVLRYLVTPAAKVAFVAGGVE